MTNPIGEGRAAQVYPYSDGVVVKLFRPGRDGGLEHELLAARAAFAAGYPTPQPLGQTVVDGRRGILYASMPWPTMLRRLGENPMGIRRYAHQLAALHAQLHALDAATAAALPPLKDSLRWQIQRAERITGAQRGRILSLLDTLPDTGRWCHMDFHPDNILVQGGDAVVIDWANAGRGNPCADICRTVLMLEIGSTPDEIPAHLARPMRDFRASLARQYLAECLRLEGLDAADVAAWQAPIAAARLCEGIDGEAEALLTLIEEGLEKAGL